MSLPLEISDSKLGAGLAIMSAIFWGVAGACAQYVFQNKGLTVDWLVSFRLLSAGGILLLYAKLRGRAVGAIWRDQRAWPSLLIFGLIGMLGVQYTYFAAIRHSNAATGTVLQYVGPTLIVIYFVILRRRLPTPKEAGAVVLAFVGTLLLATHGELSKLEISSWALFWGLSSAVALAFCSIQPVRLLRYYEATVLVGWAMLIGGLGFSLLHNPWTVQGTWEASTVAAVAFIVIFGTVISFVGYLNAVKKIGPEKSSLLACGEPLSAAITSVVWLSVPFGVFDWLGAFCIIATIVILNRSPASTSPQ